MGHDAAVARLYRSSGCRPVWAASGVGSTYRHGRRMSHNYYLKETSLEDFTCAAGSENHVHAFGETIRQIEARCRADVASLFAEPVPPSNADPDNPKLSWYTSAEGRVIELGSIDETARGPIVATLRSRLQKLRPI